MYRPKEPQNRRPEAYPAPAGRGTGMTYRGSLLDRIDEDRFNDRAMDRRRFEDHGDDEDDIYGDRRAQPTTRNAAPREGFAESDEPRRSALDGVLEAQIASLSEIGIGDILSWLRGGLRWIILVTVLCVIAAFVYAATATPRYTVYTDIIIDPQNLNVVNDDVFASNPQRDSQLLQVESTLRVLTSRNVLKQVIADMNLTEDPEFTRPSPLEPLFRMISGKRPPQDKELAVLMELGDRVGASREERSFVVTLGVWTGDPEKSVKLSEAIVRAFEMELFTSSAESAGRIAATLNGRLDELRKAVTDAEEKVEQFKRDNNIQASNTGELASSRISSALDTQVLDAQQRLIQAEARYNQMRSAVADRRAVTATIFDSPGMQTLRTSYNTLQQQIGSLTLTYGARHPRLISMQSEKAALEKAIGDEANRILETAKTDADQARAALAQLRGKADAERTTVYTNNDAQVRLRELERDARAKAAVYETYLGRTHQITERQQIDTSNVRVISPPVPPKSKSWPPRTIILLAAGGVAGVMLGAGLALVLGLNGHLAAARRRFAYRQRYA
ncbi:GumC family protein [Rhizobium terrae]|uniref:GumC family protein n=1 Tax=Rhizobium terrae TaxID=2171756 RepID=UPI001D00ADB6|nr:GumC family protein [Rhizobium terrae]